jgi:pyridoxine kinase
LTDIELKDIISLRQSLTRLHDKYKVPNVVISSIPLTRWLIDKLPEATRPPTLTSEDTGYLLCLCSSTVDLEGGDKGPSVIHAQCVPLLPGYFSGVGDLFSALLLGHFQSDALPPGNPSQTLLSYATSMALTKTHGVLKSTYEYTLTLPEDERQPSDDDKDVAEPIRKLKRMRGRELRLVQPEGQSIIRGVGSVDTYRMNPWLDFWDA